MSRKKTKFNFLDALLILAVIALVAGAIWRRELSDRIDTENIENTVTVCCEFEVPRDDRGGGEIQFEEGRTAVYLGEKEVGYVEALSLPDSDAPPESGGASGGAGGEASGGAGGEASGGAGGEGGGTGGESAATSEYPASAKPFRPSESPTHSGSSGLSAPSKPPAPPAAPDVSRTVRETRLCLKVVSRESGYYINGETKLLEGVEYRLNTKTTEFTALILSVKEEQNK